MAKETAEATGRGHTMRRYHVHIGKKRQRTTVSFDDIVADYLALHLGHEPDGAEAHSAVRAWLQGEIDHDDDPGRRGVSQWLLGRVFAALVRPDLSEAFGRWEGKRRRRARRAA